MFSFMFFSWKLILKPPHEKTYLLSPSSAALIRILKVDFSFWASKLISRKKLKTWNGKGKTWRLPVL
jgi:hypothetical protein